MSQTGRVIQITALALFLPWLGACQNTGGSVGGEWGEPSPVSRADSRPGPPAHAPAHGRRAQQREYRYYPRSGIYFDTDRGVYFYYSDGRWRVSAELPRRFRLRLGEHITLEAHSQEPWRDYQEHRRKYPPGLRKTGRDHPGQGRGLDSREE
ncbi:hypothetical protein [Thiohalophilus sp.]|uniref:hypothetical protein n=1 Tax=Thiohalophilus sp. TaxID=3028392 RepID=UPI002ACD3467|nr:hypothetical protein [Thiohalophilus sp.]MDZ7805427.1 hypothetical protein [Thiohalophilus sp.]